MDTKDVFEKLKKQQGFLPGELDAIATKQLMARAARISSYLEERGKRLETECDCCSTRQASSDYQVSAYDTPWDDEPRDLDFCSEECEVAYLYSDDFAYSHCAECGRLICQQNPKNGWHWQFRDDYSGEPVCLKCYEELVVDKGTLEIDEDKWENGNIPGMFHDDGELEDWGYEQDREYHSEKPEVVYNRVKELDEQGYKCLVNYESISIVGDGGWFSLWKKPKTDSVVLVE